MKYQNLFSGKNKKNISQWLLLKFLVSILRVQMGCTMRKWVLGVIYKQQWSRQASEVAQSEEGI